MASVKKRLHRHPAIDACSGVKCFLACAWIFCPQERLVGDALSVHPCKLGSKCQLAEIYISTLVGGVRWSIQITCSALSVNLNPESS